MLDKTAMSQPTLKKNAASLHYYLMREGTVMHECRTAYVNESNLLNEVLPFSEKRRKFVRKVLMYIYGSS